MTYQEFIKKCPNKEIYLYISGSQGVSPAELKVTYGIDFNNEEEFKNLFCEFIDENAMEYIDDYLEDCDYDIDEALGEAVNDSGEFLFGFSLDNLEYEFDGFFILKREG
jgi:hypothetical protein